MVRAVRLSATLGFAIEPATLDAIAARAELVRHLSGERLAIELEKLLGAATPSVGLRPLASTGLLEWIAPELAAQRGIPQSKIAGEDLWDHTVRTVDAAPVDRPIVRLAALVHDIGKPATFAEGRFLGHDSVGADLADSLLRRLKFPRATTDRVVHLVRQHMFSYESVASDAAIRRFIAKIGEPALDELFDLRRADNVGSGLDPDAGGLAELRERVADQLAAEVALDRRDLAIDGEDLIRELGRGARPAARCGPRPPARRRRRGPTAQRPADAPAPRPEPADRGRLRGTRLRSPTTPASTVGRRRAVAARLRDNAPYRSGR